MNKENIKQSFKSVFHREADYVFSCGGRFEILGNHTDHNHGLCLAATCNLEIVAAVKKASIYKKVVFHSAGYPVNIVCLMNLNVKKKQLGTSSALIRGVADYFVQHGYKVGGFAAYSESSIFPGAGVSSSAAFELLIAQIFNVLYNDGKISTLELAKAGQYAENVHFGKASGLLDQIGVAYGNISYIDFADIANPKIETVKFDFPDLHFVIINSGGSHAALSHLYSQIPEDMYNAAKKNGVNYLRDVKEFKTEGLSDIEKSRAEHFFGENKRVAKAVEAIKNKDKAAFLRMINESRVSSTNLLKNMMVEGQYEGSPLELCDYFLKVSKGKGAIKINGGGFAGSCIAVVEDSNFQEVLTKMQEKYGVENAQEVFVRTSGPKVE